MSAEEHARLLGRLARQLAHGAQLAVVHWEADGPAKALIRSDCTHGAHGTFARAVSLGLGSCAVTLYQTTHADSGEILSASAGPVIWEGSH